MDFSTILRNIHTIFEDEPSPTNLVRVIQMFEQRRSYSTGENNQFKELIKSYVLKLSHEKLTVFFKFLTLTDHFSRDLIAYFADAVKQRMDILVQFERTQEAKRALNSDSIIGPGVAALALADGGEFPHESTVEGIVKGQKGKIACVAKKAGNGHSAVGVAIKGKDGVHAFVMTDTTGRRPIRDGLLYGRYE